QPSYIQQIFCPPRESSCLYDSLRMSRLKAYRSQMSFGKIKVYQTYQHTYRSQSKSYIPTMRFRNNIIQHITFTNSHTDISPQKGTQIYPCIKKRKSCIPSAIVFLIQLSHHRRNIWLEKTRTD